VVVITCQINSILPRAITTNRCGKARSKEEVRRQKVDGNDRTTGLRTMGRAVRRRGAERNGIRTDVGLPATAGTKFAIISGYQDVK
jgi:uncharacterized protein (UPF0261 family)